MAEDVCKDSIIRFILAEVIVDEAVEKLRRELQWSQANGCVDNQIPV